jgi:cytochrome c biogenesis protein CcmG, thiol:disulfide interchange protein DsbE
MDSVTVDPVSAGAGAGVVQEATPGQRGRVIAGLIMALVIVAGAWVIGGSQGFDQLGRGGVNSSLLPKVGDVAPDFATILSDGRIVRLSDFRGQPVWLNFWGSWCPPCRAEMPDMEAAYKELGPRGLVMLAVALDEPPAAAFDYAARNGATYLIASDPKRESTSAGYPIVNFPTHILIDRDGIVRQIVLAELDKDGFLEYAEPLLGPGETS